MVGDIESPNTRLSAVESGFFGNIVQKKRNPGQR